MKKGMLFFAAVIFVGLWTVSGRQNVFRPGASEKATTQITFNEASQKLGADMDFGRMPVYFIANEGQIDEMVAYYITGKDKQIYFTQEGVTFVLADSDKGEEEASERWVVKLDFVGADKEVFPRGEDETGTVISYFKGSSEDWRTGIATYSKVVYANLWPGIDLVYRGAEARLKYEFIVHPGAEPGKIRMQYRGACGVAVNEEGELEVETPVGSFADGRPVAYQEQGGKRVDVGIEYDLHEGNGEQHTYGFRLGEYDRSQDLILDPAVLIYCGYIGGSLLDSGEGIAVDSAGNAYVTGHTGSFEASFPVTVGPDLTHNDNTDAFVAKVNSAGTGLLYCGFIGGSSNDYGRDIAVDSSGNAYIVGETVSTEASFPEAVGPDLTHNGAVDAFVAKVNATGTGLSYCGYIGGDRTDIGLGIAVDSSGNAYITGETASTETQNFPVTVGPDLTYNGSAVIDSDRDAFVAKVNATGAGLVYCGYIGGSDNDYGNDIAIDGSGNAYVTGHTQSREHQGFPLAVGPDLTYNGGNTDAFVAKVNSTGSGLVYCGYIGGALRDKGLGIAVDSSNCLYITGETASTQTSFPVTVGPDLTYNGGISDGFVVKVNPAGTGIIYCGYIGGSDSENSYGIAVDGPGNAYITGNTASTEATFPVTVGPDLTHNGYSDAFIAKIKASGTSLVYCGYIGGSANDYGNDIALDGFRGYVVGKASSSEASFPVTIGPDLTKSSEADAFVAKIHHYTVRNDFSSDGQEDILWRNYVSGANAVWYLNSTGATAGLRQGNLQALTMEPGQKPAQTLQNPLEAGEILYKDERVYHGVLDVDAPQEKIGANVYKDALEAGPVFYRPGAKGITGDIQDLMKPGDHKAGVQAISILATAYLNTISNTNWRIEATGDLNGDGKVDVLWRNYATGQNAVWYMNSSVISGAAYLTTITDTLWRIEGTGDFNGDGNIDLLWRHYGAGQNALWYMSGAAIIGTAYLGAITDTNWRIEATGDFNGDGDVDFVWRNYATGQNALWYMSGSTHSGTVFLSAVADVYWAIAGVGDFNKDGNTDLLWRHYGYGSHSLWYMSGTTIIGTEALTAVGDLNWRIENH